MLLFCFLKVSVFTYLKAVVQNSVELFAFQDYNQNLHKGLFSSSDVSSHSLKAMVNSPAEFIEIIHENRVQ